MNGDKNGAESSRAGTVLYDAECGLCRACVRWLRRRDKRGRLRFVPLPNAEERGASFPALCAVGTAECPSEKGLLPEEKGEGEGFDSMVFVSAEARPEEPECLLRTDALIAALRACGGGVACCGKLLGLVPRALRDTGYRFVARYRRCFFGR